MLVLIAHGSRNEAWRQSLEKLTRTIQKGESSPEVRLAFMQFTGPTLEEVVAAGREAGVRAFRILPLFMASAGHVDKDIRPLVEDLSRKYPDTRLDLLSPIGEHPLFYDLIQIIAQDAPQGGER